MQSKEHLTEMTGSNLFQTSAASSMRLSNTDYLELITRSKLAPNISATS